MPFDRMSSVGWAKQSQRDARTRALDGVPIIFFASEMVGTAQKAPLPTLRS
jgi:hypothetical protein